MRWPDLFGVRRYEDALRRGAFEEMQRRLENRPAPPRWVSAIRFASGIILSLSVLTVVLASPTRYGGGLPPVYGWYGLATGAIGLALAGLAWRLGPRRTRRIEPTMQPIHLNPVKRAGGARKRRGKSGLKGEKAAGKASPGVI